VSLSACSAWAAQAGRLLEGEEPGAVHGYLLIPVAYEQLARQGDPAGAAEAAGQAVAVGRRFADPDLLALALTIQGRALLRSRRVPEGMTALDESVALVGAGDVSPSVAGLVLTAAVDAGDEAFEFGRCDEWTRALARWCDRQDGMLAFRCRSLTSQAAVERRHGRWEAALGAAERACVSPIAELDQTAAASASYQQGEILRLRGERKRAEAAYRQAGELGLDPQPGLALLRLAEGDGAAASASLHRALGEARSSLEQARLLPAQVEVQLAAGDRAAASEAARALETIARGHGTAVLEAASYQATAAVVLGDGDPLAALTSARLACRVWRHLQLPYEEAQSRVLIARCCRALGDESTAALELEAACEILAELGAAPDLDRARAMLGRTAPAPTHRLTRREREVLELLATGLTNRAIAEQLQVTTRTVDTHVSSILTKLGVSNRAAATAFAHRHELV
jgi:DNA-binding CsgD family transcriptional regulator